MKGGHGARAARPGRSEEVGTSPTRVRTPIVSAPRKTRRVVRVPLRLFGGLIGAVIVDADALRELITRADGFVVPHSEAAPRFMLTRLREAAEGGALNAALEAEWFEADADAPRVGMLPHHRDRDRVSRALTALEGPWGADPENADARAAERGPTTEPWPALTLRWVRVGIAHVLQYGTADQRDRLSAVFRATRGGHIRVRGGLAYAADLAMHYEDVLRAATSDPKARKQLLKRHPHVGALLKKRSTKLPGIAAAAIEIAALDSGYAESSITNELKKRQEP